MAFTDPVLSINKASDRKTHTFFRFTARNDTVPQVAISEFTLYDLAGVPISSTIASVDSSPCVGSTAADVVDGSNLTAWTSEEGVADKWVQVAIPGRQKISGYKITVPSDASAAEISDWRLERLLPDDTKWDTLETNITPSGQSFSTIRSGILVPIRVDVAGSSDVPIHYSPSYDFTGTLPLKPSSIRVVPRSKVDVSVKWTGNSSDLRPTDFVVARRVKDGTWAEVATVLHTTTTTTDSSGVTTTKYKNITSYADTIPDTSDPVVYEYCVKSRNVVGDSAYSDVIEMTSLTDNEVYVMGLEDKMMMSIPLTMDESATLVLKDRVKGADVSAMIANKVGSYQNFKAAGFSAAECSMLAILALCMRDGNALLQEQFARAQTSLNTNSAASSGFMTWAKDHLTFNVDDMVNAANTPAEKELIIEYLRSHGYLTV